jgi:hypothetical protein
MTGSTTLDAAPLLAAAEAGQAPLAHEIGRLVRQAVGETLRAGAAADSADSADAANSARAAAMLLPPAAQSQGAIRLAAAHANPKARAEALQLYTRCLMHYRSHVQKALKPTEKRDDLGLAAAYFTMANLGAIDGREPDAERLPTVERQLRHLIALTRSWGQTSQAERQALFEQLALLGVLVNESRVQARTQGEAAQANVKRAARGYLQQLLGLEPELLVLGPEGLGVAEQLH